MLLVWERGGGGSAGVTQAGQHQGSLRLVVVSFSYDQQHGWCFSSVTFSCPMEARSRQKTGCKQGWNFGKQIRQSEREARKSRVWARECLE